MRSLFILFVLILAAALRLQAQLQGGLRLGYHRSGFVPVANRPAQAGGNPEIGATVEHSISGGRWLVQSSPVYTTIRYQTHGIPATDADGNTLGTIRLHRVSLISIPLTLAYQWPVRDKRIRISVGPDGLLAVGDRVDIEAGDRFGNGTAFPAGTTGIRSWQWNLRSQLALRWPAWQLAVFYEQGLQSFYANANRAQPAWTLRRGGIGFEWFIFH